MAISREDLAPRDWPRSDRMEWNLQSALRRLREARKAFANAAGHPQRVGVASVLDLMNRDSEPRSDGGFQGVNFKLARPDPPRELESLQIMGRWYSQEELRNIIAKYAYLYPAAPEFQTPDPVKERIG